MRNSTRLVVLGGRRQYVLDLIPRTAAVAYGLRRLYASWTGAAIRVRRSSDNAEIDIGFIGENLDVITLLAFVGVGNGFITTWYDQSGNGSHATTQTVTQPNIIVSGVLQTLGGKPTIRSFGNSVLSFTSTILGSATEFTFNSVSTVAADGIRRYGVLLGSGQTATNGIRWGLFGQGPLANDGIGWAGIQANILLGNGNLVSPNTNYVQSFIKTSTAWTYFQNGNQPISSVSDNSRPSGLFRGSIFSERDSPAYPAVANISELLIFPSAFATSDRQAFERNQGIYFNISVS